MKVQATGRILAAKIGRGFDCKAIEQQIVDHYLGKGDRALCHQCAKDFSLRQPVMAEDSNADRALKALIWTGKPMTPKEIIAHVKERHEVTMNYGSLISQLAYWSNRGLFFYRPSWGKYALVDWRKS